MMGPEATLLCSTFPTLEGYASYVRGVRFLRWKTPDSIISVSYVLWGAHGTERLSSSGSEPTGYGLLPGERFIALLKKGIAIFCFVFPQNNQR
jgi:hypothetical protein